MNSLELKAERIRQDVSPKEMAQVLGLTTGSYYKKEQGVSKFTVAQVEKIIDFLSLSPEKTCIIFFTNKSTV